MYKNRVIASSHPNRAAHEGGQILLWEGSIPSFLIPLLNPLFALPYLPHSEKNMSSNIKNLIPREREREGERRYCEGKGREGSGKELAILKQRAYQC